MKRFFAVLAVFCSVVFFTYAQREKNINRITLDIYTHPEAGTWFYYLDGAYKLNRYFDFGATFGTLFLKEVNSWQAAANARFYFSPLLLKKPEKMDLYVKGSAGYYRSVSPEKDIYPGFYYDGYLGIRYWPLTWMGVMGEGGFNCFSSWSLRFSFGLSFRFGL